MRVLKDEQEEQSLRLKLPLILLTLVLSPLLSPLVITNVQAAPCSATCNFEADTNVPVSEGAIRVRLDGTTNYNLNRTFTFAYNTSHTLEVLDVVINAPSGARYVFKQWSYNGLQWSSTPMLSGNPFPILANYVTGDNGPFVAVFEKQFQASFSFTDPAGQPISPPSYILLQGPPGFCPDGGAPPCTVYTYSNRWLAAAVWTVTDAVWQNMPGMVYGTPTIDLTAGPRSLAVPLRTYPATVKVVDRSNNPLADVSLTVTFSNSTSKTLTTDNQGQVQLGHIPLETYNVRVVYQNQTSGPWVVDASVTPSYTITLDVGSVISAPVVSAFVLLTIFGLAMFLILLAVKVRKPPLPPTI